MNLQGLKSNLCIKIGKNLIYEIDLQDNVNYFPVIQFGDDNCTKEAHLVT